MVNLNDAFAKLKVQLLADKRKAGVLCALSVVLLVVAIRTVLKEGGPEASSAATDSVAIVPAVSAGPSMVSGKEIVRPIAASIDAPASASFPVGAAVSSAAVQAERTEYDEPVPTVETHLLPRALERNPFNTTAWAKFPLDIVTPLKSEQDEAQGEKDGGPFWTRLARAMEEHQRAEEALREKIAREIGDFSLQSTMTGPTPLAYISGRLVGEGETFEGFSVVRISNRRVVLSKSGIVQELVMP